MKTKILWLCSEKMNHSGDFGNLLALCRRLAECGVETEIDRPDPKTRPDWPSYGLILACDGPLEEACACMERLTESRLELLAAEERGAVMLFTGAARVLLGRTLTLADGRTVRGCGLLAEDHRETRAFRADVLAIRPGGDGSEYVGSYDRRVFTDAASEKPLFQMLRGIGDKPEALYEGACRKNLYATHFLGPVLPRNPALLEELVRKIAGSAYRPPRDPGHAERAHEIACREIGRKR